VYPWHPWFGRIVRVREATRKGGEDVLRCSLTDDRSGRCLELPAWMFARKVCAAMRLAEAPVAELAALGALRVVSRVVM